MNSRPVLRAVVAEAAVPVAGAGAAFAFLEAGAFTNLGPGTLERMISGPGLRAALLGSAVTALLLIPVLVWRRRRPRR